MFRSDEQRDFFEKILAHVKAPEQSRSFAKGVDGPLLLEGGAGLGVSRAGLMAAVETAKSGMTVAVVLPSTALLRKYLSSADFAELVPVDLEWAVFPPSAAAEGAADADEDEVDAETLEDVPLLFCTSASVILDRVLRGRYTGVTFRDYLIFDDADRLPDFALHPADSIVDAERLRALGIVGSNPRDVASRLTRTAEAPAEIRAAAALVLEALDESANWHSATLGEDGSLVLSHRMPGRLLRRVANNPNVAFIGGSLTVGGQFDAFKRAMGIGSHSILSAVLEPKDHGALRCFHASHAPLSEEWFAALRGAIDRADKPCLVLAADDQQAQAIATLIPDSTLRLSGSAARSSTAAYVADPVLIASASWAGLDSPAEWRTVIIARIPIDAAWGQDEDAEDFFVDPRNLAIRRLRKIIRQGVRRPDAQLDLHVLDHRTGLAEVLIPGRFKSEWAQRRQLGGRATHEESALERAIAAEQPPKVLRDEAFRVLGKRCMTCNLVPKPGIPLEIHLLRGSSVQDMGRSLEDEMAVLCMACHRLAHSTEPPLTLAMLRGFHERKRNQG